MPVMGANEPEHRFLHALYALRPSLVLSIATAASLAIIAWGGFSIFADSADPFSW